jgi:hypothetical protein
MGPSRIKLLVLPRLPHWTSLETGTNAVDSLARGDGASLYGFRTDKTGQNGTVTRQYAYKDDRSDPCDNASTDRRAPDGSSGSTDLSATPST